MVLRISPLLGCLFLCKATTYYATANCAKDSMIAGHKCTVAAVPRFSSSVTFGKEGHS